TLLERGHIIQEEDVSKLLDSGVYYVWIDEGIQEENTMYEWEITPYVASKIVDDKIEIVSGKQGITLLYSRIPGLLEINVEELVNFNLNQKVLLITKRNYTGLGKGDFIGSVEVIPFSMKKSEVDSVIPSKKLVSVIPFKYKKLGVVITGTEIFEGRKKDLYLPVLQEKARKYDWSIISVEFAPDDEDIISKAVLKVKDNGAEAVIVTGGTSVDPTDRTFYAIKKLNANVISYGIPMKPTTMSIVAMLGNTPIFAVSAGGIYYKDYNSIDVVFTRLMAGRIPTPREIAEIGHGGIMWNFEPKMKIKTYK
ncbi:MAG: molybdopterin-binding protein, partial [Candidatus Aramenus sulfurataquae]